MTELNTQPDGLRIPDELLGGAVDPELEEYIRDMIWMRLAVPHGGTASRMS